MKTLRDLRNEAGISQNELAARIERSTTFVWTVEMGRRRLTARETIEAWADALGLPADEVYRAAGQVPHDIIDALVNAEPAAWEHIRGILEIEGT